MYSQSDCLVIRCVVAVFQYRSALNLFLVLSNVLHFHHQLIIAGGNEIKGCGGLVFMCDMNKYLLIYLSKRPSDSSNQHLLYLLVFSRVAIYASAYE